MNDRVMQFRIGMFVIVAGLVLAMMLIWFGERPSLFRDHGFLVAHYDEAPGVNIGVPVRKSGIRIGEVTAIEFDERDGGHDGVLVTMSLDRKIQLRAGSVPRISRALIGDVSIEMTHGEGDEPLLLSKTPKLAQEADRIVTGLVAADPSKALAAATKAFEKVEPTLEAIRVAASGVAELSNNAKDIQSFIETWKATGAKVGKAADGIERVIKMNEDDVKPAITSVRNITAKVEGALDDKALIDIKTAITHFSVAAAKLDQSLTELHPLITDLGAVVNAKPLTNFGQTIHRINRIAFDISLLSGSLNENGKLNTSGSLQKILTNSELHDSLIRTSMAVTEVMISAKPAVNSLRAFADKVARDPGAISRGALQR